MLRIVAGEWGGRRIQAPSGREVRPTTDRVREAWMSALHPALPGARVLDLFAGSGALGLECLSRGAREVVFVERSRPVVAVLRRNIETLGAASRCRVVTGDALVELARLDGRFDLALADPPYASGRASGRASGQAADLVRLFRRSPFAEELWLEHARDQTMPPAVPPRRQRRYGDTLLSTYHATDMADSPHGNPSPTSDEEVAP